MNEQDFAAELRKIVGDHSVLIDSCSRGEYGGDMTKYKGYPAVIVKPNAEQEVIDIVRLDDQTRSSIEARGGRRKTTLTLLLSSFRCPKKTPSFLLIRCCARSLFVGL